MRTDLIKARKKAGLTQQQLAKAMGVYQSAISKYESGELAVTPMRAKKMASVLDIDVLAILYPKPQRT